MGSRLINARSETVAEKPSFRSAFRRRRCLVPADGFFEWKREEVQGGKPTKTPFWIHRRDRALFTFAGLWERWEPEGRPPVHTFTILTTEAAPGIAHIHPRMPVILHPRAREVWLAARSDPSSLQSLLHPYESQDLQAFPVSTLVNSPKNDDPACIEAAGS
jgi:putative SOS response-associated peptidase YedK